MRSATRWGSGNVNSPSGVEHLGSERHGYAKNEDQRVNELAGEMQTLLKGKFDPLLAAGAELHPALADDCHIQQDGDDEIKMFLIHVRGHERLSGLRGQELAVVTREGDLTPPARRIISKGGSSQRINLLLMKRNLNESRRDGKETENVVSAI